MTTFTQKSLLQRLASKKGKKQNGFTLIELMVVVAIVGVLSAVGLPQLTKAQDRAKDAAATATLTNAAKECSLSLIINGDKTDYADSDNVPLNANFASVTEVCEADTTLKIESDTGTDFQVVFVGSTPGVVAKS